MKENNETKTPRQRIVQVLRHSARLSNAEIAAMVDGTEDMVAREIASLEKSGIIRGYSAIIDEETLDENAVVAQIELCVSPKIECGYGAVAEKITQYREVDSVLLMSGGYDLLVIMRGKNFREIASFVADNLATMDGVTATRTHFTLQRFKEKGVLFTADDDEREISF